MNKPHPFQNFQWMVKITNQLILYKYLALFAQNHMWHIIINFAALKLYPTSQIIVDIFAPLSENRKKTLLVGLINFYFPLDSTQLIFMITPIQIYNIVLKHVTQC